MKVEVFSGNNKMTAIGAMPDELSKVIHDFIRPTEAYEVILERGCWMGEVITKKFRTIEEADKCYDNWKLPEDGENYKMFIFQTYPVKKHIHSCEWTCCQNCGEYGIEADGEIEECERCCQKFCSNCYRWTAPAECYCDHCWNSDDEED